MSKANTRATINANIKQNGNQEITGQILNSVLNTMVDDYAEQEKLTELNQSQNVSLITSIGGQSPNIPNISIVDGTISFGPENAFVVGNDLYSINNQKPFTLAIKPIAGSDVMTSAVKLVLNTQDSSIRTMPLDDALSNSDILVGVFRVNYGSTLTHIFGVNLPFEYTIDDQPQYAASSASNVVFITSPNHKNIPNIDTIYGTISFGEENAFIVGNKVYVINQAKPFTLKIKPITGSDVMTSAVKLVLNTQDSSIRTMPLDDALSNSDILVGVFRVNYGSTLTHIFGVNLPFEYTIDGESPENYGSKSYNYEGDKVEIGNSVQMRKQGMPFTITELQGMTAFDKYLIRTGNEQGGRCNIMNVKDGSILGDFILASKSDINHANCVELGEKYSSEDIIPLIYISEASGDHRCFVERIKNDFSGSSLIQTISFIGTYPENAHGNDWALDIFNKRLYNCISTANYGCKVLVFNLPDCKGGDISLSDNDIIDTFDIPIVNIMQGVTFNSGKLFLPLGFGTEEYPAKMVIYDVTRKSISSRVNLQTMIQNEEPEDVCVLNNQLLLGTQSKVIYWFKF